MNNNCALSRTHLWFQLARPQPSLKDQNSQLGCHYEEVAESLEQLEGTDLVTDRLISEAYRAIHELAEHLKAKSTEDLIVVKSEVLFLDALADQVVTGTGVAYTRGYDFVGAMTEVNRSNFSKFDAEGTPLHDANGKVIKGPLYSKAALNRFVPV